MHYHTTCNPPLLHFNACCTSSYVFPRAETSRVSELSRSQGRQSRRKASRSDNYTTPGGVPPLRPCGERDGGDDAKKGKTERNPRLNFISGGRLGRRALPLRKNTPEFRWKEILIINEISSFPSRGVRRRAGAAGARRRIAGGYVSAMGQIKPDATINSNQSVCKRGPKSTRERKRGESQRAGVIDWDPPPAAQQVSPPWRPANCCSPPHPRQRN
ncbi:hypothetical protein EVAR_48590_1 [Eumeta japonica]|uniref:Uncharacterized protein n=1 Tax=Eumeta variegata TaxID=151549 RepID=A0A4C1YZK2_EUMVA|nr:hypothetical protein EVAR_48590_1 [Eumeta japonica]